MNAPLLGLGIGLLALLALNRSKTPSKLAKPDAGPVLAPAGLFWDDDRTWRYIDAWHRHADGSFSRSHVEQAPMTDDEAIGRFLDVVQENFNSTVRRFDWTGSYWQPVQTVG